MRRPLYTVLVEPEETARHARVSVWTIDTMGDPSTATAPTAELALAEAFRLARGRQAALGERWWSNLSPGEQREIDASIEAAAP